MAGAIQRKLIGPIWSKGTLVANVWLGRAEDPEAGSRSDLQRAGLVTLASGLLMTGVAAWLIAAFPVW